MRGGYASGITVHCLISKREKRRQLRCRHTTANTAGGAGRAGRAVTSVYASVYIAHYTHNRQ